METSWTWNGIDYGEGMHADPGNGDSNNTLREVSEYVAIQEESETCMLMRMQGVQSRNGKVHLRGRLQMRL